VDHDDLDLLLENQEEPSRQMAALVGIWDLHLEVVLDHHHDKTWDDHHGMVLDLHWTASSVHLNMVQDHQDLHLETLCHHPETVLAPAHSLD